MFPALPPLAEKPQLKGDDDPTQIVPRYVFLRHFDPNGSTEHARVWDRWLGREALWKAARRGPSPGAQALRLISEARRTARLSDLHVPQVFDLGWLSDGRPYITMEWIYGQSLRSLFSIQNNIPEARAIRLLQVLATAARAVDEAHARGIVHRDLKPEHLIRLPSGAVVVLDWELAAPTGRRCPAAPMAGTPPYMAPERGLDCVTAPTEDIYALGAMLFEILTGQPLFSCVPPLLVQEQVRAGATPRVEQVAPPWAAPLLPLFALADAALDVDPARRPPHARGFAHVIEAFLDGTNADPR